MQPRLVLKLKKTKNVQRLKKIQLKKINVYSFAKTKLNYKRGIKLFSMIKLIFNMQPVFLRAKSFFRKTNRKKGHPLAVFKTFRSQQKILLLNLLKYSILPAIKNLKLVVKKKNSLTSVTLSIPSPFVFLNLQSFFLYFRNSPTIFFSLNFYKITQEELYFLLRFLQLPFKS